MLLLTGYYYKRRKAMTPNSSTYAYRLGENGRSSIQKGRRIPLTNILPRETGMQNKG